VDKNASGKYYISSTTTGNLILVAQWIPNTAAVTYVANGASGGGAPTKTVFSFGENIPFPVTTWYKIFPFSAFSHGLKNVIHCDIGINSGNI
jgi:hypothetical protein